MCIIDRLNATRRKLLMTLFFNLLWKACRKLQVYDSQFYAVLHSAYQLTHDDF